MGIFKNENGTFGISGKYRTNTSAHKFFNKIVERVVLRLRKSREHYNGKILILKTIHFIYTKHVL